MSLLFYIINNWQIILLLKFTDIQNNWQVSTALQPLLPNCSRVFSSSDQTRSILMAVNSVYNLLRYVSPIFGWKACGLRSKHALTARDRSSSCCRLLKQLQQLQSLQNSPLAKHSQYLHPSKQMLVPDSSSTNKMYLSNLDFRYISSDST